MARLSIVLVFGVLVQLCLAACPQNCNNHGTCHGNTCTCSQGYGGDDCSIEDTEIQNGVAIQGSLESFRWHYYHISVSNGASGLRVSVNQTSQFGDVDVYVQRGSYPTQRYYLEKDISTKKNIVIEVNGVTPDTWYVGLYGYWNVGYNVSVTIQNDCTIDCGPHGVCQNHACVCSSNYVGESCDIFQKPLTSGALPFEVTVATNQWVFFTVNVNVGDEVFIKAVESDDPTDVDLYMKSGSRPTMFDFDYLNATIAQETILTLPRALSSATYYIGCYGYRGGRFTIQVTVTEASCQNTICSQHGTCSGGRCNCNSGYTGDDCETKTSTIGLDEEVRGTAVTGSFNYYKYLGATENNVIVKLNSLNNGDCDVFIQEGRDPTRLDYSRADLSYNNPTLVSIDDPGNNEWHIGIYGWTTCEYTLSVIEPDCECRGTHGRCESGSDICICDSGYAGDACDIPAVHIINGQVFQDQTIKKNEWKYYYFTMQSSAVLISLKETDTKGFLWLFLSMDGYPELDVYDVKDEENNTDLHEIHSTFKTNVERTFYIGVYGDPYDISETDVRFSLTVWSPPF